LKVLFTLVVFANRQTCLIDDIFYGTKMIKKTVLARTIYLAGLFAIFLLAACGQATIVPTFQQIQATTELDPTRTVIAIAQPTPSFTPRVDINFTPTPGEKFFLPTATSQSLFRACSPLKDHTWADLQEIVTNPFNPPPPGKDTGHPGVDFAYYRRGNRLSIEGVPIQSVLPGSVAAVVYNRPPYGNMVIIETPFDFVPDGLVDFLKMSPGQSVYLLYAHMKASPLVALYQQVSCGEQLGEVGNTPPGWSSAPHLHLEARVGPLGKRFFSMAYYDNSITLEEKSNYELWRMSGTFQVVDPLRLLEYLLNPAQ
jgi:murein DD-endopeptidase MepM/ murein hydrolase activator NlpD